MRRHFCLLTSGRRRGRERLGGRGRGEQSRGSASRRRVIASTLAMIIMCVLADNKQPAPGPSHARDRKTTLFSEAMTMDAKTLGLWVCQTPAMTFRHGQTRRWVKLHAKVRYSVCGCCGWVCFCECTTLSRHGTAFRLLPTSPLLLLPLCLIDRRCSTDSWDVRSSTCFSLGGFELDANASC